ncbi:hypothetical protein AB1Y20_015120 [Prymnesium parvum]|uniref:Uncharacterized protein n=1 Tax=Prymnesium parvum TaxID=97485 RepID=A0AB34JZH4_PRYPA
MKRRLPWRTAPREVKQWRMAQRCQGALADSDDPLVGVVPTPSQSEEEECVGAATAPSDEEECVGVAMPELARWCRQTLRDHSESAIAQGLHAVVQGGLAASPSRMLRALSDSAEGRAYLLSCASRYEAQFKGTSARRERARLLAALGSISEATGQLHQAMEQIASALCELGSRIDPSATSGGGGALLPPPLRQALHSVEARADGMRAVLLSELVRLRRQAIVSRVRATWLRRMPSLPPGRVLPISREGCISAKQFFMEYALLRRPVVLKLPDGVGLPHPWSFDFLSRHLNGHIAELKTRVEGSCSWAGLENAGDSTIGNFVDSLHQEQGKGSVEMRYLFDWSLPLNAPSLLEGYVEDGNDAMIDPSNLYSAASGNLDGPNLLLPHADRYDFVADSGSGLLGFMLRMTSQSECASLDGHLCYVCQVCDELAVASLRNPQAAALLQHLSSSEFDSTMDFSLGDLPWNLFKRPTNKDHPSLQAIPASGATQQAA